MATCVEKMGVASGDIGNCTGKLYIHEALSLFSCELDEVNNSCTFSFADYRVFPLYGNLYVSHWE